MGWRRWEAQRETLLKESRNAATKQRIATGGGVSKWRGTSTPLALVPSDGTLPQSFKRERLHNLEKVRPHRAHDRAVERRD